MPDIKRIKRGKTQFNKIKIDRSKMKKKKEENYIIPSKKKSKTSKNKYKIRRTNQNKSCIKVTKIISSINQLTSNKISQSTKQTKYFFITNRFRKIRDKAHYKT